MVCRGRRARQARRAAYPPRSGGAAVVCGRPARRAAPGAQPLDQGGAQRPPDAGARGPTRRRRAGCSRRSSGEAAKAERRRSGGKEETDVEGGAPPTPSEPAIDEVAVRPAWIDGAAPRTGSAGDSVNHPLRRALLARLDPFTTPSAGPSLAELDPALTPPPPSPSWQTRSVHHPPPTGLAWQTLRSTPPPPGLAGRLAPFFFPLRRALWRSRHPRRPLPAPPPLGGSHP